MPAYSVFVQTSGSASQSQVVMLTDCLNYKHILLAIHKSVILQQVAAQQRNAPEHFVACLLEADGQLHCCNLKSHFFTSSSARSPAMDNEILRIFTLGSLSLGDLCPKFERHSNAVLFAPILCLALQGEANSGLLRISRVSTASLRGLAARSQLLSCLVQAEDQKLVAYAFDRKPEPSLRSQFIRFTFTNFVGASLTDELRESRSNLPPGPAAAQPTASKHKTEDVRATRDVCSKPHLCSFGLL